MLIRILPNNSVTQEQIFAIFRHGKRICDTFRLTGIILAITLVVQTFNIPTIQSIT